MQIIAVAVHVQLLMAQQQRVCLTTSQRHGLFARSCWIIPLLLILLLLLPPSLTPSSSSLLLFHPKWVKQQGQEEEKEEKKKEEEEEEDRLTVDVLFSLLKFSSFFDLNSDGCRHFPWYAVQCLRGGDRTCFGTGRPQWMRSSRSWWWHWKDGMRRRMACINELPGLYNSLPLYASLIL